MQSCLVSLILGADAMIFKRTLVSCCVLSETKIMSATVSVGLAHQIVVINLMGSSHQVDPSSCDILLNALDLRTAECRSYLHEDSSRE